MDLLPFLNKSVELSDSKESELIHQVDLVWVVQVMVLVIFNTQNTESYSHTRELNKHHPPTTNPLIVTGKVAEKSSTCLPLGRKEISRSSVFWQSIDRSLSAYKRREDDTGVSTHSTKEIYVSLYMYHTLTNIPTHYTLQLIYTCTSHNSNH